MRIHHDDAAALRAIGRDARLELALGDVLQVLVDRELDGRTGRRRTFEPRKCAPARVGLDENGAGFAPDLRVVCRLEAAQSLVVDADVTEQVRSQRLVGIEAANLLDEADAT